MVVLVFALMIFQLFIMQCSLLHELQGGLNVADTRLSRGIPCQWAVTAERPPQQRRNSHILYRPVATRSEISEPENWSRPSRGLELGHVFWNDRPALQGFRLPKSLDRHGPEVQAIMNTLFCKSHDNLVLAFERQYLQDVHRFVTGPDYNSRLHPLVGSDRVSLWFRSTFKEEANLDLPSNPPRHGSLSQHT
jgi:hypothetical protein